MEYDNSRAATDPGGAVAVDTVAGPGPSLDAVRELMAEYGRHPGIEPCLTGFDAELAGLPGAYAGPDGTLLLARLGSRPVGCVAVRRLDAGRCEMKRLYVRPAFRAAGIGILLAQEAIAWARGAGYRVILLDTLPAMPAAPGRSTIMGIDITRVVMAFHRDSKRRMIAEPDNRSIIPGTEYDVLPCSW